LKHTGRTLRLALALPLVLLLPGCGGPRVNGQSLLDEFSRYENDVKTLQPLPPASDALKVAQAKRDQAKPLIDKGGSWEAFPTMEMALADVRFALAAARTDKAQIQADECLRTVEKARQDWEETVLVLEQTERIAKKQASNVVREIGEDSLDAAPLPPSNLNGSKPPADPAPRLSAAFQAWLQSARSHSVTVADLESRFNQEMALATGEKAKERDIPRHLYVAGRALQELESRVREDMAKETCLTSTSLAARFGDSREQALRATIELERGLKDDLRQELEKARAEASERQADLYDALHKLEGRFATITRNARGTIVSLADILFDFNKATLKRDVEFSLVKIATILGQFPEMNIQVEGHTDNVGTPEYNLDLSLRRATAVRDFMVEQGVAAERMSVEGFGLTRPVADNTTEEGRQKNRRVDLVINDKP
jgi:outer membrane protein OmpA-like peptidoglycan-associated protein